MPKSKSPFVKQKLWLYFDENFPRHVIDLLSKNGSWRKKCKIFSAHREGNRNRDDQFHYEVCKKNDWTLVTLDGDFMDDSKFPIMSSPGIIRIVARRNDVAMIQRNLQTLLDFLSNFPFPRGFARDAKFEVSRDKCFIRGREATTGKIKSATISGGDTVRSVAQRFGY